MKINQSIAALPALTKQAIHSWQPMVLVDGLPCLNLWVESLEMEGVLDRRSAVLRCSDANHEKIMSRLAGCAVAILQPIELATGQQINLPLFTGRLHPIKRKINAHQDQTAGLIHCDWSSSLDQKLKADFRFAKNIQLGDLLDQLVAVHSIELHWPCLEASVLKQRIGTLATGKQTIGSLLERVCDIAELVVQHDAIWMGHHVAWRRTLRSSSKGRLINITQVTASKNHASLICVTGKLNNTTPVKWIARSDGQMVESTFSLTPGWAVISESKADQYYNRSASDDFDSVVNTYRLWVLNEDGALGEPAYSLTGLFNDGQAVLLQPLPFGSCLTTGPEGRSLGVVLEVSLDDGQSWSRYSGQWMRLKDRAGVYLDDDLLPTAYFNAAKSHQVQVRVTATLQNPQPTETIRWHGNPFAGQFQTKQIQLGAAYQWKRVADTSQYYDDVLTGNRNAAQVDDRGELGSYLAEMAVQQDRDDNQLKMQIAGPGLSIRIGDRYANGHRSAIGMRHSIEPNLHRVVHFFNHGTSELTWRW